MKCDGNLAKTVKERTAYVHTYKKRGVATIYAFSKIQLAHLAHQAAVVHRLDNTIKRVNYFPLFLQRIRN